MESISNTEILPQKLVLEFLLVVVCVGSFIILTSTGDGMLKWDKYKLLKLWGFFLMYIYSIFIFFHPAQVSWSEVFSLIFSFIFLPGQAEPVQWFLFF